MAKKQEQESARSEVIEVAPNVLRMELPIHMPGLGHVNMYALIDGEGAAVVDPGLPGPLSWRAIEDRLKRADLRVKHVHTVLVTHSHPDHFGGASRFAKQAGSEIVAHRHFRFGSFAAAAEPEVSVDDLAAQRADQAADADGEQTRGVRGKAADAQASAIQKWKGTTPWGGPHPRPPLHVRMRWQIMRRLGTSFLPTITKLVSHGDVLRLAGREWFVVHTPGHTEDHFCLHCPEEGVFLAGDHVLPSITPHISGLTRAPDPLNAFFDSLDLVGKIDEVKQVLPAHGHPFQDLRGRAEAIKRHHYQRLDKVKEIGRELGPSKVEAYSKKLFARRSWGAMAESETFAHLEHLLHAGDAERREDERGVFIYATG